MNDIALTEITRNEVTFYSNPCDCYGVTFLFSERQGGLSCGPFASLNLSDQVGDTKEHVKQNRRRLLSALLDTCDTTILNDAYDRLIVPHQVHGTHLVHIHASDLSSVSRAQREARSGADGVVCTAQGVNVLLCFADCVPIILVAPGGFAVLHSGWRGTYEKIAEKGTCALCDALDICPSDIHAYIGPHIMQDDYEVSSELMQKFSERFGKKVVGENNHLALLNIIEDTLVKTGVCMENICHTEMSTYSTRDKFFSYRAEGGVCGRHGALACMPL